MTQKQIIDKAISDIAKNTGADEHEITSYQVATHLADKLSQSINTLGRYLFVFVDGEYKFIQYVEGKDQEEAERKMVEECEGWVRIVEITEDMQVVYNGR